MRWIVVEDLANSSYSGPVRYNSIRIHIKHVDEFVFTHDVGGLQVSSKDCLWLLSLLTGVVSSSMLIIGALLDLFKLPPLFSSGGRSPSTSIPDAIAR